MRLANVAGRAVILVSDQSGKGVAEASAGNLSECYSDMDCIPAAEIRRPEALEAGTADRFHPWLRSGQAR